MNLNVDQGGLSYSAKLQGSVNREALVLSQRRTSIEKSLSKKIITKRRSLGQDSKTGKPLPAPAYRANNGGLNGANRITQDPAANRQILGRFIIVVNTNEAMDDVFNLSIKQAERPGDFFVQLTGVADFSFEEEQTAYLYVDQILSNTAIDNLVRLDTNWVFRNIYRQVLPSFNTQLSYELLMKNIKNNDNANFGLIVYGVYSGTGTEYYEAFWSGGSGEDLTVLLDWGRRYN